MPTKTKKKARRKNKTPKIKDGKPDPERWIPKTERSSFARKGKFKFNQQRGPQGVAGSPGGGIGGTGSANIGVHLAPSAQTAVTEPVATTKSKPSTISKKNKKKK